MKAPEVWNRLADERVELADLLDAADPSVFTNPSLCGGWRVHDVLAHLVSLAEAQSRWGYLRAGARIDLRPMKSVDKVARRLATEASPRELTARLRAAKHGQFTVPGMPPIVALGEVLVHRADIAVAAGLPRHAPDHTMEEVLRAELKLWFAFGVSPRMQRCRFIPLDADWRVGPDKGTVIEAPGEELLLIATGRG